jgi:hypothetical protein
MRESDSLLEMVLVSSIVLLMGMMDPYNVHMYVQYETISYDDLDRTVR